MFTKEDFIPAGASRLLHTLSPFIATVPALISFAVIPYGATYTAWGETWSLVGADLDYGILYVFAVGSIATYGSVLAGWASNNNWGMLGSLRVSAQMLSYEVAMGISVVGLFMIFGTLKLTDMGVMQQETFRLLGFMEHFGWVGPGNWLIDHLTLPKWGIFLQPLSFFIFMTAALAENKRPPFDTPEGEAEIIAGYFIEYSGMKFGLYTMGELLEVVVIAGLLTAMFLGGWSLPWIPDAWMIEKMSIVFGANLANVIAMLIHVGVFFGKLIFMIMLLMMVRWTMPRFRYDQVMDLGWKIMLPLSLGNIVLTGFVVLLIQEIAG
jgi:NADH-quinone oxidoreductase subunit H